MRLIAGNPQHVGWTVLLAGQDVSDVCYYADDDLGEVGLYVKNGKGRVTIDPATDAPAIELRHGAVELIAPGSVRG